ncbi:hypothetical protein Nepgr_001249 [Nepenthes gracilis]|uniref:GATA transcription factor n=1 Tax=Nepenthes gracilis TaxID=150966 RepID=A0AAD3P5P7_NEPGR|nr:hypothetical protein Nepgr_001249 [Nepenthes gracilis]
MAGTSFMDEVDCGRFFDHIDDLLEFPNNELESGNGNGNGNRGVEWEPFPPSAALSCDGNNSCKNFTASDSVFSANNSYTTTTLTSDLSAQLSIPYDDIAQLEWLSNFVEDSFSWGDMTAEKANSSLVKDSSENRFQSSSPVSAPESSSSCSNGKAASLGPEKRARSKRPRPATFNHRPAIRLISPTSSVTESYPLPSSEYYAEYCPLKRAHQPFHPEPKKKNNIKILHRDRSPNPPTTKAVRKCMHCELTKTPQWRAGPMGPKTLCNACGVRYKSGRLFPEYRPAASPTFVPSLHSNSHKKVLEMRSNNRTGKAEASGAAATAAPASNSPEIIPSSRLLPLAFDR